MYFKVLELYIYKKIPYDFTIRVYFAFSLPCQKCVFDNLGIEVERKVSSLKHFG